MFDPRRAALSSMVVAGVVLAAGAGSVLLDELWQVGLALTAVATADAIRLDAGDPSFNTAPHICDAAFAAMRVATDGQSAIAVRLFP